MLLAECPALPPRKSIMLPARLRGSSLSAVARSGNVSSVRILPEKKKRSNRRWLGGVATGRSQTCCGRASRTLLRERATPPRGLLQRHRALSHASCGGAGGGAARGGGGGGRCAALRCAALRSGETRRDALPSSARAGARTLSRAQTGRQPLTRPAGLSLCTLPPPSLPTRARARSATAAAAGDDAAAALGGRRGGPRRGRADGDARGQRPCQLRGLV